MTNSSRRQIIIRRSPALVGSLRALRVRVGDQKERVGNGETVMLFINDDDNTVEYGSSLSAGRWKGAIADGDVFEVGFSGIKDANIEEVWLRRVKDNSYGESTSHPLKPYALVLGTCIVGALVLLAALAILFG